MTSPSFNDSMWLIDVSMLTDWRPCEFEAKASALSASAYVIDPCAMPNPLSMSFLTVIDKVHCPSEICSKVMSSHWLNASLLNILSTISFGVIRKKFCCPYSFSEAADCNGNGLHDRRCTGRRAFRH